MKNWFQKNPKLLATLREEVEDNFPFLRVINTGRKVVIKGTYELVLGGIIVERLHVLIVIPDFFPREIPALYEVGGRFPKTAKRHFFLSTKACLFVEEERFKYWQSNSIKDFINGPVRNFFVSQVHYEKTGEWPFGDRSHDEEGLMEFYREYFDIHNYRVLLRFLEYFAAGKIKGSHKCPCESGRSIKGCKHGQGILDLNDNVERQVFKKSLRRLKLIIRQDPKVLTRVI